MEGRIEGLGEPCKRLQNGKGLLLKILQFSLWDSWYIKNENLKSRQAELRFCGCTKVADLFDESMTIISYNNFCDQFTHINFLDYASLIASLPMDWKRLLSREMSKPDIGESELVYKIIADPKTCKFAYKCFSEALPIAKPHEIKWREKGINIPDEEWRQYNALPYRCTKSTKLQAFQYKIIHRILGIGVFKKLCNIVEDDVCSFCAEESETLLHLFTECPVVNTFWDSMRGWVETYIDPINLDPVTIMFGDTGSCLISHVILTSKYYIFLCQFRKQRPCLAGIKSMWKAEYDTEKHIAKQNKRFFKMFKDKWEPFHGLWSADI